MNYDGFYGKIMGFGKVNKLQLNSCPLMVTDVPIYSRDNCLKRSKYTQRKLALNTICGGNGTTDACNVSKNLAFCSSSF